MSKKGREMRSYYAHLETVMGPKTQGVQPKPTLRSSAIFPMIQTRGISSRVLFMGYWILKRNIKEIACIITLRNAEGIPLSRQNLWISEPKTFRVELSDQLTHAGLPAEGDFTGSLEIEFFSTQNFVFPFPALVVNFYGPHFSTVVHTAQRIYNDFDDMQRNSQTDVPESGFNIHADNQLEPFIAIINGPVAVPNAKVALTFYNHNREILTHEMNLETMAPYETKWIYPAREVDLKQFLNGHVGSGKIHFHVNWIFPRLVVGNFQHDPPALTITHTYYDCSDAKADSDYWRPTEPNWYPASLMIPVVLDEPHFTNIYFYPIYSPSSFFIDIELYNEKGERLGEKQNALHLKTDNVNYRAIHFKLLCKELNVAPQKYLGARLIARNAEGSRLPSRIKLAIDIGRDSEHLPCNICTNLQPFNPPMETKPKTFRWAPLLADQPISHLWIMNSSPAVHFQKEAEVELNFYREQDTETLNRKLKIPPHGFFVLNPLDDKEVHDFLKNSIGWVTAVSSNPYTTTYYFAENPSGVVGGDHGF